MTILKWALIFLLVSIVAGIFGFTGISAASADVARFLFYVFVVIFLVLLILGLTIFRVVGRKPACRHCERSAAIQISLRPWIASLSLSSGVALRRPVGSQ